MALITRFIPHAAKLNTLAGVVSWINQVESYGADDGISMLEETTGSETDRAFTAIREGNPTIPLSTTDLSLLTTIGFGGVPLASGGTHDALTLWGRESAEGALPTAIATTNHIKCLVSNGLLVPVSISGSHNQAARLSLMVHPILGSDTNAGAEPMVFSTGNAITAGAGQTANIYAPALVRFTTGASSPAVSPRLVTGLQSIGVDFGIGVNKESTDSEVFPTFVSILSRMPKIEFSTKDPALRAEIGSGVALATWAVYFQQFATNGQRVLKATATHIKVSGTLGMINPGGTRFQHKQTASSTFSITPVLDTGTIITVSVTSAVPTT